MKQTALIEVTLRLSELELLAKTLNNALRFVQETYQERGQKAPEFRAVERLALRLELMIENAKASRP